MSDKIRLGIVGANAERGSWGTRAHIPALKSLGEYELKAICTAHEETAVAAQKAFGSDLAFHDYNAMVEHPDIDLVSVVVRVPSHHQITMAALRAGKDTFCEWPLGANLREAQEMVEAADAKGVRTIVGLQARSDPVVMYAKKLIDDGFIGEPVATHMTLITAGSTERAQARLWSTAREAGANPLTIAGGHNIDALCFCLGEFTEVSGKVTTQVRRARVTETGEMVEVTAPDNVMVTGTLESGAVASIHIGQVPFHGGNGWRMEIWGTRGTLVASGGQANYSQTPLKLMGAQGKDPIAEMPVPGEFLLVPEGTPEGAPFNVAQAYVRFADARAGGRNFDTDFKLALQRHRLLDALERASSEGKTIKL
jgi:predicted dehydrogenase